MKIWGFLAKDTCIITLKPASHGNLAVLVRKNQAQKCLQCDLKCFQLVATKFKKNTN